MQAIVQEYIAWAGKLRSEGRMLGGDELSSEARMLRGAKGQITVTDGPFAETKETIGGYFLIEANDEAHAVEIAKQCPGLKRDGAVELRQVVEH
jgi:hypothetical protein